jgi:hypothetical protein
MPAALGLLPGQRYPSEMNRDGRSRWYRIASVAWYLRSPIPSRTDGSLEVRPIAHDAARRPRPPDGWLRARPSGRRTRSVGAAAGPPTAYASGWSTDVELELLRAEGPAGLRHSTSYQRRVVERSPSGAGGVLHIFLPPFTQADFSTFWIVVSALSSTTGSAPHVSADTCLTTSGRLDDAQESPPTRRAGINLRPAQLGTVSDVALPPRTRRRRAGFDHGSGPRQALSSAPAAAIIFSSAVEPRQHPLTRRSGSPRCSSTASALHSLCIQRPVRQPFVAETMTR